ncbi:hypothetical protein CHS0354_014145 [Potamilus streckersoni]|uniref:Uncharacterized protein n=1 Tax=Potamilus streckersoni TaxID=2493646 RepID=A0AAE0TKU3_9BIVA|nr:hypothetical protein CHS0354_014145 [Potamilus streckersoni]
MSLEICSHQYEQATHSFGRLMLIQRQYQQLSAACVTKKSFLGKALLASHGQGYIKGGLIKARLFTISLSSSPVGLPQLTGISKRDRNITEKIKRPPPISHCGKRLKLAACLNIRVVLYSTDSNRPERRSDLISRLCFNISTLSKIICEKDEKIFFIPELCPVQTAKTIFVLSDASSNPSLSPGKYNKEAHREGRFRSKISCMHTSRQLFKGTCSLDLKKLIFRQTYIRKAVIVHTSKEILGFTTKRSKDWIDENNQEIKQSHIIPTRSTIRSTEEHRLPPHQQLYPWQPQRQGVEKYPSCTLTSLIKMGSIKCENSVWSLFPNREPLQSVDEKRSIN